MKKTRYTATTVAEPAEKTWSNCLRVDDLVFVSGMTARGADGTSVEGTDAYTQSTVIFRKIRDLLVAADAAMDDVVKMTIFVTDIADNQQVWQARAEFFEGNFPACSLVQVAALAKPEILVEIEAIAVAGCSTEEG